MVADKRSYEIILEAIIQNKIRTLGQVAITKVSNTKGIRIDDKGHIVFLSGNPEDVMKNLLSEFQTLGGNISLITAKLVARRVKTDHPEIEIPLFLQ